MRSNLRATLLAFFVTTPLLAQVPVPGTDPNSRLPADGEPPAIKVVGPQANIALPNAAATMMGNSNNYFGVGAPNQRYQQIHDGTSVGSARPLFGHAYRMRNATYAGGAQSLEIKVATTSVAPSSITTNMTTNITGAQTTVFKGTYNYPPMAPNSDPTKWQILFPWSLPWPWTAPTGQHFALEILNSSTTSLSYFVDAFQNDASVYRCYGSGTTATTGSIDGFPFGLAICLFTSPIPPLGTFDSYGKGCPGTGGKTGVILPASMRTAIGNSNNIFGAAYFNQRYHQIFNGAEIGQARIFTGHGFRPGTRSDPAVSVANVEILLASTKNAPSAISATYASNINGTLSQVSVLKSTVNYPQMVPSTNPSEFRILVPYTRQFVWTNPPNEHLLYEYVNSSLTSPGLYYPNAHSGDTNTARLYAQPSTAAVGAIGQGYGLVICFQYAGAGSNAPALTNSGTPVTGKTFYVVVSDAQTTPGIALLFWGLSDTNWGAFTLPLALDPFGAKGCQLLTAIDVITGATVSALGQGSAQFSLPNDSTLHKLALYFQWAVIDPGANVLKLAFSNGGKAVIGGV